METSFLYSDLLWTSPQFQQIQKKCNLKKVTSQQDLIKDIRFSQQEIKANSQGKAEEKDEDIGKLRREMRT
jgi:hypothetical protein